MLWAMTLLSHSLGGAGCFLAARAVIFSSVRKAFTLTEVVLTLYWQKGQKHSLVWHLLGDPFYVHG